MFLIFMEKLENFIGGFLIIKYFYVLLYCLSLFFKYFKNVDFKIYIYIYSLM